MDLRLKIKKVLNYLNKTYKGNSIYESFNEDTASLDDAFTALREAIVIENKLGIDQLNLDSDGWIKNGYVSDHEKVAKALIKDMDIGSADQNTKLMNCALELNGYNTTFTDVYGEGITDAMDQFGQNLCAGTGYWEGLGGMQTIALISNVPTHLAEKGKQNIRDAQIMINKYLSGSSLGFEIKNNNLPYVLGRTDGIVDGNTLKSAYLVFQNIIGVSYTDELDDATKKNAGNYYKVYNDSAKPLIKASLIFHGFYDHSFDDDNEKDFENAENNFALASHTTVDSADFFIALFAYHSSNTIYVGTPKFIVNSKQLESTLGYTTSTGFQAMWLSNKKLSMLKYDNGSAQDSLFEFDLSKTDLSKSPINLSFDDDDKHSTDALLQEKLGHTQSLFVDGDYYYMGCDPDENTKHKWAQDIVRYTRLNNKLINPKKITNIKCIAKTYNKKADLNKIHRVDFAVSPDKKWIMIGLLSIDGTQYEFLYDFDKFSKVFNYSNNDIDMKAVTLDWHSACSIPHFCDSTTKYPYDRKSGCFLPSLQGYALGNNQNTYFSSGLAPKDENKPSYVAHFVNMPFGEPGYDFFYDEHFTKKICFSDPLIYSYPKNVLSALATDLIHPFAEPEAIQYLPEHNSILLSVTWHLDCTKNIFTNNPFFKIYGHDKTFIYEIPVVD